MSTNSDGSSLTEKYAEMSAKGIANLQSGAVTAFQGFDTVPSDLFIVALALKTNPVYDAIIEDLMAIEGKTDAKMLIAGRDFPLHVTVLQATGKKSQMKNFRPLLYSAWYDLDTSKEFSVFARPFRLNRSLSMSDISEFKERGNF